MDDFPEHTPFSFDVPHDLDSEDCWCYPDIEELENGAVMIVHYQGVC